MPSPHRDEHDFYISRYLRTGEARIIGIGREVLCRRRDGSVFPADLAVSEVCLGRRLFTGMIRDISERKALEREVLEIATAQQRRIGQELHDDTGQQLTALGLLTEGLVDMLRRHNSPDVAIAAKVAAGLRRCIAQVREFSRGLIPLDIDGESLPHALAELASRTNELHVVDCSFECSTYLPIKSSIAATHMYRIAQEAVANALRHAQARSIEIRLRADDRMVTLKIRDDGRGIAVQPRHSEGMGLKIMRYRADLIHALLAVEPGHSGGTVVTCVLHRDLESHDAEKTQPSAVQDPRGR